MSSNNTENIYSAPYGGSGEPIPANKISYDNTASGMTADDAQEAIDELASSLGSTISDVEGIQGVLELPSDAADGTYVLKATVADGEVTYAWVVEV